MRKMICLLISLILCASMVLPALAAENSFVPSIEYKEWPLVVTAYLDGESVDGCVIVTSIKQAEEKDTDISQEERDLLLEVYEKLKDGSMELPLEEGYVIRELVDVSFAYGYCRQNEEHGHKGQKLMEEGTALTVTFNLDVASDEAITVLAYVDGKWAPIESVKNNGDGTVTCVFEDICPVAFVANAKSGAVDPTTGDRAGNQLVFFVVMMVLSVAGIVALLVAKARKAR